MSSLTGSPESGVVWMSGGKEVKLASLVGWWLLIVVVGMAFEDTGAAFGRLKKLSIEELFLLMSLSCFAFFSRQIFDPI
jgi:hypothetical protein